MVSELSGISNETNTGMECAWYNLFVCETYCLNTYFLIADNESTMVGETYESTIFDESSDISMA